MFCLISSMRLHRVMTGDDMILKRSETNDYTIYLHKTPNTSMVAQYIGRIMKPQLRIL